MRMVTLLFLLLTLAAPVAWGQQAAPLAVRTTHEIRDVSAGSIVTVASETRFRGKRVLVGAAIGAAILGTLGGVAALSACDQTDCGSQWISGARIGATVGGVLGGLFGLIAALPARD